MNSELTFAQCLIHLIHQDRESKQEKVRNTKTAEHIAITFFSVGKKIRKKYFIQMKTWKQNWYLFSNKPDTIFCAAIISFQINILGSFTIDATLNFDAEFSGYSHGFISTK